MIAIIIIVIVLNFHYIVEIKNILKIQIWLQRTLMFPASPAASVSDITGKQTN